MQHDKKKMIETLKALKVQVASLAKLQIEEASKQIDAYTRAVEAERQRRKK